jgi:hypothetical protein
MPWPVSTTILLCLYFVSAFFYEFLCLSFSFYELNQSTQFFLSLIDFELGEIHSDLVDLKRERWSAFPSNLHYAKKVNQLVKIAGQHFQVKRLTKDDFFITFFFLTRFLILLISENVTICSK